MSEEAEALGALRAGVATLSNKIDTLEQTAQTSNELADQRNDRILHRIWAIAAAGVVMLILLGVVTWALFYTVHVVGCVKEYANANAARTNVLTPLANARADALDGWIRILPDTPPKTAAEQQDLQAQSEAKRLAYLQASDAYSAAVQTNPPPLAPGFTC